MSTTARFGGVAIVAGEPIERELQHHFGRARRPAALAFHVFKAFEKAADVEQKADEFGPDRVECLPHALARRNDGFGEGGRATAGAAILRHRRAPVRRDARHELGAREIGAQSLAGLELHRLDQRAAVAALAAREPDQRTLGCIHIDAGSPGGGLKFSACEIEMLGEKWIDLGAAARDFESRKMRAADRGDFQLSVGPANRKVVRNENVGIA